MKKVVKKCTALILVCFLALTSGCAFSINPLGMMSSDDAPSSSSEDSASSEESEEPQYPYFSHQDGVFYLENAHIQLDKIEYLPLGAEGNYEDTPVLFVYYTITNYSNSYMEANQTWNDHVSVGQSDGLISWSISSFHYPNSNGVMESPSCGPLENCSYYIGFQLKDPETYPYIHFTFLANDGSKVDTMEIPISDLTAE